MNITEPLRLATGSHQAGSGKGCAMNVISWENGDTEITDLPACSDPMLARIVQRVNDLYCRHTNTGNDDGLLCPSCSIEVLALAHRTVGSAEYGGRVVWVKVACRLARDVAHLNTDPRVMAAIEAAEAWVENPTAAKAAAVNAAAANAAAYAAKAADPAAYAAADPAAYAAANAAANAAAYAAKAADPAANAADDAAAEAAAYAAAAKAAAAYAAPAANAAIDYFNEITGRTEQPPNPDAIKEAITRMQVTA